MPDPIASRVYRRFLAATIGDPAELLGVFRERILAKVCAFEHEARIELPKIREVVQTAASGGDVTRLVEHLAPTAKIRSEIRDLMQGYWYAYRQREAEELCHALLQQYELPAPIRKKIELASRFWSKSRFVAPRTKAPRRSPEYDLVHLEAYLKLCDEVHAQERVFDEALRVGRRGDDVDAVRKLPAGPFSVVNTGGFDEETMKNVAEIVKKAAGFMQDAGLGKVCYGDVLVSQTISNNRNVLAFYLPAHDEMFVRANLRGDFDTIQTVCHELAHRLSSKFLASKQRAIESLYRALKRQEDLALDDPKLRPTIGEVVSEKGKRFKVTGVGIWDNKIKLEPLDEAPLAEGTRATYSTSIAGYHRMKGTAVVTPFVTTYAKRSAEENFAEMTSFYAMGKLPEALKGPLEAILAG